MRTTGIRLIADVDQFKRAFRGGADAVRHVQATAERATRTFRDLGRNARQANDQITKSQAAMRSNIAAMDAQIGQVRQNLQRLSTAYAQGNTTVVKQMNEQQKRLKQLTDVRKLLPGVEQMTKVGVEAGRRFDVGFLSITKTTAITFGSFLGGAVLAALPLLGAAITGIIIGGAGVGGVVGGIVAAAKDPRVAEAGKQLGATVWENMQTRAQQFFVQPLLQSISRIQSAFFGMSGDLDRIMQNSARFLRPLTEALAFFMQRVVAGLANLTDAADPVIDALGNGIAQVGSELKIMFDSFKDNGVDAAVAIGVVFDILNSIIRATGIALNILTETFGFLAKVGAFGEKAQREYIRLEINAKLAAEANRELAGTFGTVSGAGAASAGVISKLTSELLKLGGPKMAAAAAADAHARAVRGETGAMKELNDTIRAQIDPLFAFAQAQKKVEEAQKAATEATRKHGAQSTQAKNATRTLAEAALDLQGKAGGLAGSFDGRLTPSMRATFTAAGLTKTQIKQVEKQLIEARKAAEKYEDKYGADVFEKGAAAAAKKFIHLSSMQRALEKGSAIPMQARKAFEPAFAEGGWTGPGHKHQPAGIVHADEFVVQKSSRRKIEARHPGLLEEMNATGQIPPGYAAGGAVRWPYPVTAAKTKVPTVEQALAAVMPKFGEWPSSPSAQRGDSGIWRRIVAMIRATGPMSGAFGNAYRPGDPKWHGSGRAVDWMGYNQDGLARFLAAKRPLELIHRTRQRDYAYTRGRNRGSFSNGLMEAHRNHIHIAMNNGGLIREPVVGVGASGATYSFGEQGPERVLSSPQTAAGAAVTNHIQVTVQAPVGSHPREIGRQVVAVLQPYFEGGGRLVVHGQPVLP